ncbi:hypothetical protein [Tepidiphilus olei]|jgi:hypothetical protein|uniref:hypothetical protein n=1 Tax=Tepidiphilus olei TaxID=2502184 RepID=UPI00115E89E4|nr:hypothetical protein [Tepidiphilus olei]
MKILNVPLSLSAPQAAFLTELQRVFAEACNLVAAMGREAGVTARVALHHLCYATVRERFPALGSQLACNAIYAAARAFRKAQEVQARLAPQAKGVPIVRFAPTAPVFFDRHTLSLRGERVSMFTLDGRLHFDLSISPEGLAALRAATVKEAVLQGREGRFVLSFYLEEKAPELPAEMVAQRSGVMVDSLAPADVVAG